MSAMRHANRILAISSYLTFPLSLLSSIMCCTSTALAQRVEIRFDVSAPDSLADKSSLVVTATVESEWFIEIPGNSAPEISETKPGPATEGEKEEVKPGAAMPRDREIVPSSR